ncbi:MAG: hypothetical protein AAGA30_09875 [Planctomycetota bacterium]
MPIYVPIIIALIVIGMNWWLGSWNILLNLTNFFIASMFASAYFEPLADTLESSQSSFTYLLDFVSIWLLFVVVFVFLRVTTDFLSKYQLRMHPLVEHPLRAGLAVWLAGGFVCFAMFTMHLAPIPSEYVTANPTRKMCGFGPDQMWMAFIQSRSRGAHAASKNGLFLYEYDLADHPDDVDLNSRVFDPHAQFAKTYIERRSNLARSKTLRVLK